MNRLLVPAAVLLVFAACVGGTDYNQPPPPLGDGGTITDAGSDAGTDAGTDAGYDAGVVPRTDGGNLLIGEWNLEFFGNTSNGPTDEVLQEQNVATVIGQQNADIWALEEVCDGGSLQETLDMVRTQTGEDYGFEVARWYYSNYGGSWAQSTALAYRKGMVSVIGTPTDVYDNTFDPNWGTTFASRDPFEVHLQVNTDAGSSDLWVIVVHLKALSDTTSWSRRQQASIDLKHYIDTVHPNDRVMVVGDFNDDLDSSITSGEPSPFQNLIDDSANYQFASWPFSQSNTSTTISGSHPIDHHLISNELFGNLISGSQRVLTNPPIANYSTNNTSDHYPTFVEYRFP